jgi:DNA repair exonuclease SbcCD ATPase subunit
VIRRVQLENWRAYRHLDLPIDPGVTFLVAANGVGKSSLLEAVRWVLSPAPGAEDPTAIRLGHDEARATVTVTTGQGELEVGRVMRRQGRRSASSFEAALNGQRVPESAVRELLAEAWSADLPFAARTAFLTEDLRTEADEPDLQAHLCRVYSLDELQRALTEIGPALIEANRSIKTARAELSATAEQLTLARQNRVDLEASLASARSALNAVRERHAEAQQRAEQAAALRRQKEALAAWEERSATLRREIEDLAHSANEEVPVVQVLGRVKQQLRDELEATRAEQARLSARLDSIEEALTTLQTAGGQCPVCLRELDNQSRQRAEHLHRDGLIEVRDRLQAIDPQPLVQRLQRVEAFELQAVALGERPNPAGEMEVDAAEAELAAARAELEQAAAALREVQLAVEDQDGAIERISAELAESEQLQVSYRQVALLEAAQRALSATISSVLSEQLGPLASEVARRWSAVFPDRPNLTFAPDGTMSREAGGVPLTFQAFSAGEKVVAKLMMRITTLLTTTKVPFCWVDEPLEHLDPRSRHLVGSMLAHLSTALGLEQILVTTYEEPLARRLAEFQPGRVRVQYLRAEQVS